VPSPLGGRPGGRRASRPFRRTRLYQPYKSCRLTSRHCRQVLSRKHTPDRRSLELGRVHPRWLHQFLLRRNCPPFYAFTVSL
jgi:hypothetical protein